MEGTPSEEGAWATWKGGGSACWGIEKRRALAFVELGSGLMCLGSLWPVLILFFPPFSGEVGGLGWGWMVGEWEEGSKDPFIQLPLCSGVDGLTNVSSSKSLEFSLHSLS